ncbi:hypothetical protein Tco_0723508, partial [Tanacetum coccineum]
DEDDSINESNDGDDNDIDDDNDGNDGDGDGDHDDDDDANNDDNQEVNDTNDNDEETDKEEKINDEEKIDEEKDDEVTKELYNDVNMNLGNRDVDMTDVDQGGADQQNVSQESGFEQVEEDAHVTLTSVLDTQKNDEPVQSYSVSPNFTSKLLNFKNPSLADNEIASLMDTTVHHEEPQDQTSSLYTVLVTAVPEITSIFTTTVPPSPHFFNPLSQQTALETTTSFLALPDFAYVFKFNERILPQAVSDFATPVIEKNITESLEVAVLAKSSSQSKSTYEAATSLSEFELTKMLVNKMDKNKSYDKTDYKRELYDALIKSYETDKDLFDSYGETEGRKEGSQSRKLSHLEIQGQRKRSHQAPLKAPPTLNISLLANLPMQRSQVIWLMTLECNRIKSSTWGTMMNNPLTKRFPWLTGLRNPSDLQLLILIGIKDNMLTFDLLRPGLVKLHVLKNLVLQSMSSWILHSTSLHLF